MAIIGPQNDARPAFEGEIGSLGYINSKIHLTNRYWAKDLVQGKTHHHIQRQPVSHGGYKVGTLLVI